MKFARLGLGTGVLCLMLGSVASADATADLAKVRAAVKSVTSFRATMTSPILAQPIKLEYVAPDRFHIVIATVNEYIIGDTATVVMNGQHITVPLGPMKALIAGMRSSLAATTKTSDVATTDLGVVNGEHEYTSVDAQHPNVKVTFWVGANGLPARVQMVDQTGTTTIDYYDYNAPITIVPQ